MVKKMEAKYLGQGTVELAIFNVIKKIGKFIHITYTLYYKSLQVFTFSQTVLRNGTVCNFIIQMQPRKSNGGKKGSEVCWDLT